MRNNFYESICGILFIAWTITIGILIFRETEHQKELVDYRYMLIEEFDKQETLFRARLEQQHKEQMEEIIQNLTPK